MKKMMYFLIVVTFLTGSVWASNTVDLVVLHINDTHGKLSPYDLGGHNIGGIGRLSTLVKQVRAENPGRVLLLHAGDIFLNDIYRLRQYRPPVMLTRLSRDQIQAVLEARMYLTAGCSFGWKDKTISNLKIGAKPDSAGTYLVAMERQVAFRHFLRDAAFDSVVFDFTGQRVDTALERYLRDVKIIR